MVAPIILHTRNLSLRFLTNVQMITLYGMIDDIDMTQVNTKVLK